MTAVLGPLGCWGKAASRHSAEPDPSSSSSVPTTAEVALLAQFIDELDLSPVESCGAASFSRQDDICSALAADISGQPEADRPFVRYLSLTYASNTGVCRRELEREGMALFEAVNAASSGPSIVLPRAIGAEGVLYAIDLRSYAPRE